MVRLLESDWQRYLMAPIKQAVGQSQLNPAPKANSTQTPIKQAVGQSQLNRLPKAPLE